MKNKMLLIKSTIYPIIFALALLKIFFSTTFLQASTFEVKNTQISKEFDINFDKNDVIDAGFKIAFDDLILKIIKSKDHFKLKNISEKNLKSMVDTFSIKEEKFIDNHYHANIDVSFNKKKIYEYFEKQNIFLSLPKQKKVFFIPILIDENLDEITLFSENMFYRNWTIKKEDHFQLEYILPVDDLDDVRIIKKQTNYIEEYDFKEIINKYSIESYIVALIYKNKNQYKILSKIKFNEGLIIDNQIFKDLNSFFLNFCLSKS